LKEGHRALRKGDGGGERQSSVECSVGAGEEDARPCAKRGRGEEPVCQPRRQRRHGHEGPGEGPTRIAAENDDMLRRVQEAESEQELCDLVGETRYPSRPYFHWIAGLQHKI